MSELGQRIAADHRRQQQSVGSERAADLRKHARQIVDELKGKRGNGKVERFRLERKRFGMIQTYPDNGLETTARCLAEQFARRPDFRDVDKIPQHRMQPFFHVLDDAIEQEVGRPKAQRPALPRPQQGSVEQNGCVVRVWGHAGWYADPSISGNPAFSSASRGGPEK